MAKDEKSGQDAGDRVKMVKGETSDDKVAAPDGKVIERDRMVPEHALPSAPHSGMTVVEEDIFEKFYPDGVKQPLYRKLFSKGQIVPTSHYDALIKGESVVRDDDANSSVGKSVQVPAEAPARS
jgi:hypothetical protein